MVTVSPLHRLVALVAAVAGILLLPAVAPAAPHAARCDAIATTSDDVQALVDSLEPGQTGCLREGVHEVDDLTLRIPRITLTAYPGDSPTVLGLVRIAVDATGATISNLSLNGRSPEPFLSPLIYADGAVLRDNEITNEHTEICVHLDAYPGHAPPRGVLIEGNRIHDCGRLPAANHDHGIYIAHADGTVIRDNVIYDNADRGIQLWPDAQNTHIYGNVIDGNGQGISFGGYEGLASDGAVVEHNVITNSTIRHNVESYWPDDTSVPSRNVVRDNCVFGAGGWYSEADGSGIQSPELGFDAFDNLIADPRYVDRAGKDFRLRDDSPCAGVLDARDRGTRIRVTNAHVSRSRAKVTGRVPGARSGTVVVLRQSGDNWVPAGRAKVRRSRFVARAQMPTSSAKVKVSGANARDSRALTLRPKR